MKKYTVEELKQLNKEEIIALFIQTQTQLSLFEERIAEMEARLFGRKTEKLETLSEQAFNEAEVESDDEAEEPTEEKVVRVRTKRPKGKLDKDLKDIPVRQEIHELSDGELTEVFGENGWKRLPDEVYRKLEYHPATREVVEHHIAVYASKTEDLIKKAPRPSELLAHSLATPSLVAAIMNGKYTNALPLYRISQEFEREGLNLSVPTMANWVIRCAERYLYPLWDRLRTELRALPVAQADETPCHVQKDGRAANAKSFMFVYRSGEFLSDKPIVLYDYQKTRNAEHLENFLEGFGRVQRLSRAGEPAPGNPRRPLLGARPPRFRRRSQSVQKDRPLQTAREEDRRVSGVGAHWNLLQTGGRVERPHAPGTTHPPSGVSQAPGGGLFHMGKIHRPGYRCQRQDKGRPEIQRQSGSPPESLFREWSRTD